MNFNLAVILRETADAPQSRYAAEPPPRWQRPGCPPDATIAEHRQRWDLLATLHKQPSSGAMREYPPY
jgi:hypothetical protein